MLSAVLDSWHAVQVSAMEVYSDIFKLGYGYIQKTSDVGNLVANPLGYYRMHGEDTGHYRILFEDTFEATLKELQSADFAIINGISYFGRRNLQAYASKMFAIIFDLDGVTDQTLNNFITAAYSDSYYIYPLPNYIALSGHGVHLYYVFEEPVMLYPNIKLQLKAFKYAMTDCLWNEYTSDEKKIQYQGINQGFRVIGGKTKDGMNKVQAYRLNSHPFSLNELGRYIPEDSRVDERKIWRESKYSLAMARQKFPEWYEHRIIQQEECNGHWTCKRDVYDWWKKQILSGASHHHRYFCVMCLAIYAIKSGVDYEELKHDALSLIDFMNLIAPDEAFTESDVMSALECYDERYCRFPIRDIEKLAGIHIKKNKRNYRDQKVHMKRITALRDIDYPDGAWRNDKGRPAMFSVVRDWRKNNPFGTKADCIRETGLSKPTVYKYWDSVM